MPAILVHAVLNTVFINPEGASLTICWQASSIIIWKACLGCVRGSTLSSVMEGRLPCGDNVVLALDGKDL